MPKLSHSMLKSKHLDNPASLLSKCYPPKDPRLDGAFTLFYMSINIGSLIALSLAPVIADRFG